MQAASLQREPTVDELYKDTHWSRKKDNQGNWVCKNSELRLVRLNSIHMRMSCPTQYGFKVINILIHIVLFVNTQEEHTKRWQEYRSSNPSTDDSSQSLPLSERDIWVQGNLNSKGRVYGFGAEGVVMRERSRMSVSSRSSSVNNYDAREMAMRLNETAVKAAEDARQAEEARLREIEELRKQVHEKEAQFKTFQHELAQEKAARHRDKEKVKSKISKLWRFFKSQQAGSSAAPPEDDDENEPDSSHLGDSSDD